MDGPRPAGPPLRRAVGSPLPPPVRPPAGWYPDPFQPDRQRYYDGRGWSSHTAMPAAPDGGPHATLPLGAAFVALAILLSSLIGGRLAIDALIDQRWPIVVYVAINIVLAYGPSIAWCCYVAARWGGERPWSAIGIRFRWVDLGWGPLIWISALVAEVVVFSIVQATGIPLSSNTEGIRDLDLDRTYVIALLITAVVAAPVVEEAVFRGVVLRGMLSRLPWVAAVIAQGLTFGLAHVDPERGAGNIGLAIILSAVGIVLGGGAYLCRRIGPTIIAHAVFNLVVMIIVLTVDPTG